MPTLTRHQLPKFKLTRAWKIILALLLLLILLAFKNLFYELEKDEHEQIGQNPLLIQNSEIVPDSASPSPLTNTTNISKPSPDQAQAPAAVIGQLKVTTTPTGFLNVRVTPSESGQIVTQVSPGQIFNYIAQQNGWYQINLPSGQTGWVSGQFITTDLGTSITNPPPSIIRRNDGDGEDE